MTDSPPATAANESEPRTYMGMQIIVGITERSQEEIWMANPRHPLAHVTPILNDVTVPGPGGHLVCCHARSFGSRR